MKKLLLISLLIVPVGLISQTFHTKTNLDWTGGITTGTVLTPGVSTALWNFGDNSTRTTCTPELRAGKLYLRWDAHETCFAATMPPCSGHDKQWIDVYASSNGVVVLERKIEPRIVQKSKPTIVYELEWPE